MEQVFSSPLYFMKNFKHTNGKNKFTAYTSIHPSLHLILFPQNKEEGLDEGGSEYLATIENDIWGVRV